MNSPVGATTPERRPGEPAPDVPFVSVVIPCRNERRTVGACLDSILATDFPRDRLEILVVDGASDDGTRDVLREYEARDARLRVLDNPRRITPVALNIGLAAARGSVIVRMDAHNIYPPHYVPTLVGALDRYDADNVGGACITVPANDGVLARAIACALAHPLGVGNSYFRLGVREPRWVDTVPFGCFRRSVFDRIGLFDEELARNQDDELNARLIRSGGRILLIPGVTSRYIARDSLAKLSRTYFQYGYFKPLVARKLGAIATWRQLAPGALVLSLALAALLSLWFPLARNVGAALVAAYILGVIAAGVSVSLAHGPRVGAASLLAFPALHLSYGIGYLRGVVDFVLLRRRGSRVTRTAIPISR